MRPGASTRVFALLGDPVAHSLSPRFQNAGFAAAGLDAVYVALRVAPDLLGPTMALLADAGGGGNVTIPHKALALDVGVPDARAARIGAANVFAGGAHGVALGNTDVDGVLAALDALEVDGGPWCVIGTGGSARAVIGAAAERGVAVAVHSRDAVRARTLLAWAEALGVPEAPMAECAVAINATPLGLHEEDLAPIDLALLPALGAALDLTYREHGVSRWIATCRAAGVRAADGREMLLAQGCASWAWWFPGVVPPREIMRAALDGRLG